MGSPPAGVGIGVLCEPGSRVDGGARVCQPLASQTSARDGGARAEKRALYWTVVVK